MPCAPRSRNQHDERARGPADLKAASPERRNDKAANDGGVQPAVGRDPGRDGKRHRQRQRDDRDRKAGYRVVLELRRP